MPAITHAEAIARARKVAQVCKANAGEAERLRRLPRENVQAIIESDLIGLIIPRERGGYGIDSWITVADVVAEVGRVCGSSGWCLDLLIHHHWLLGMFPGEAQDALLTADPRPRIATSFMTTGTVSRAPGGFRLSGEWGFSSGIDHCAWAVVSAPVPAIERSGTPDLRFFLVGPGQFQVRDVWHSAGLKGTGSNNVIVADALVREAFTLRAEDFRAGTTPGSRINTGVMFREPGYVAFPFGIWCPLIGIARGALDSFIAFARERAGGPSREPTLQLLHAQRVIGEAAAEIDAAYLLGKDIDERLRLGLPGQDTDVAVIRRNFTLSSRLALSAVDRLLEASGARGIVEANPVQRFWRDAHAAGNHVSWAVEAAYVHAGAAALGLPVPGAGSPGN